MTVIALAIFVASYALIATERFHRTAVALTGAGLLLLGKVLTAEEAFHSLDEGIHWDVIFLLLGMMMIVAVLLRTGIFEYLAIWSAKRARGSPYRILVMLCVFTAIASALLDNVTTVLLIAPVTVLIAERIGTSAVPFLIGEALASNIGGTATLVGDPPNIIIASAAKLSYMDFLIHLGPIVVVLMVIFLLAAKGLFRKSLRAEPDKVAAMMLLDEREALTDRPLLMRSLAVLAAVTSAFLVHNILGYEPVTVALLGGGLLFMVAGGDRGELLKEVEWSTLAFFMGLFVMVGALVKVGVIDSIARAAVEFTGGRAFLTASVVLLTSGVLSGIVDNIPYVAAMAPVVAELSADLTTGGDVLWWSLALGADLGGNATIVGASANVVVVAIGERAGHSIKFWEFAKYGGIVTVVTLGISLAYVWLRYFVLATY